MRGTRAMARHRMLPHTITLFNFVGEDENYKSSYMVTILKNVHCVLHKGSVFSTIGTKPNDKADLYIFENYVIATDKDGNKKQYIPPDKWDECTHKERYWTLHDDGTDIFVKGICSSNNIVDSFYNAIVTNNGDRLVWKHEDVNPAQIENSICIKGVVHYDIGRPRMRHWEVYAG